MDVVAPTSYIEPMDEHFDTPVTPTDDDVPTDEHVDTPDTPTDDDVPTDETSPSPATPPRLYRSSAHHIIGGVAGGVGERFDIDPNIVRVVFVVLAALGGLGVAIYLAMWVLIPRTPDDGSPVPDRERPPVSTSPWLLIALIVGVVVAAVIFITAIAGGPRFGSGLAFSWLIFLVIVAIVWLRVPARRLTFGRFFSIVFLAIVSVVILVSGAFLGFLASTGVPLTGGNGSRAWQPTTITQVRSTYRTQFGTANLNLSNVKFPVAGVHVTATVSAGSLHIELPANVIVNLKTHVGAGQVSLETMQANYYFSDFHAVPTSLTTAASRAKAPHLDLDAEVGAGNITITRMAPK